MDATAKKRAVAGKNFLKETPVIRAVATTVTSGPVRLHLASGSPGSGVRVNVRNLNQIGGPLPLVLLLAACGGGGGGGGGGPVASAPLPPPPASRAVKGSLYDGPIEGAPVYVDVNQNRRVDDEDYLVDDATDSKGNFEGSIPGHLQHLPLIAKNTGATHHHQGNVALPAHFVAPAGSSVISPLTHIIELDVVSRPEITGHVLFYRFQPFNSNPYDVSVTHVFSNLIAEFLPELTGLIASTPDLVVLRTKVLELLDRYTRKLRQFDETTSSDVNEEEAEDVNEAPTVTINVTNTNDIPLTWDELADVSVAEGVPDTGLTVTTARKKGAGGEDVTYEIVDAAMRKIFKITDDGILQFRDKPDHDDGGPNSYAVKIEASSAPVRKGGITQTAEQTVTVTVTDVVDEMLSLVRYTGAGFQPGKDVTVTDHKVNLDSGPSPEGVPAGTVVYRIVVPKPDVAGNHIYLYLDGPGAERFTINAQGELSLKHADTPEASYQVTIHAREVTEKPQAHNQSSHPPKAGAVEDAAHKVVVTEVFSATLGESSPREEPEPDAKPEPEVDAPAASEETEDNTPLTIANIGKLRVTENTTLLVGTSQLSLKPQGGGGPATGTLSPDGEIDAPDGDAPSANGGVMAQDDGDAPDAPGRPAARIEYRLAGGAAHEFVEVTPEGVISLKQAPDHEQTPTIRFAVEARYVRAGQDANEGWQGRQDVTIDVTDTNDMPTIIAGGALRRLPVEENDPGVGYTPDLTTDDAVTRTIWTLSGDDAHLFTVDQFTGAISFKAPPDYEAPRDKDGDNRYEVTLSVKTFDEFENERSATQDLEINVTDVSLVIEGSPNAQFNLRENYNEVITQISYSLEGDDYEQVEYSLTGWQRDLFTIDENGNLRFKTPPNFELRHLDFGDDLRPEDVVGALYSVDVVVTATSADGRKESAKKSVWINLLDAPEAPQITLSPNPGFYILTSEESARRDTGYRVSATDEDGDPFTLSLSRNPRFRIRNDSEIWIKKGQMFGPHEADAVTLYLKATDSSPARKTAILKFKIPVKARLDNMDDMFRIVGEAEVSVDENLPVETAIFAPTIVWGAGYETSMPVIWSLGGADSGFLRIDAATGIVRFITPPDFESKKTVYDFTITAVAVGGQLVNRKDVTINIQDVDDNAPSEMLVVDVHDDLDFTPAELTNNANRKLAKIRFKDVDSQAGNDVEIDAASREFFEIRAAKQTHKVGVYQLWLKDAVTLEVGSYAIIITAVINGARVEDMQQEFTFTVTTPKREMPATNVDETPSGDDQTGDDGATDDGQPTENRSDKDNEVDRNRQPSGDDTNGNQSVDQKRDNELPTDIENNDTEENPENPDALQQLLNGGNPETRPDGQQGNGPMPKKPTTTDQGDTGNGQMTQVVDYPPIESVYEDIAPQTLDIS